MNLNLNVNVLSLTILVSDFAHNGSIAIVKMRNTIVSHDAATSSTDDAATSSTVTNDSVAKCDFDHNNNNNCLSNGLSNGLSDYNNNNNNNNNRDYNTLVSLNYKVKVAKDTCLRLDNLKRDCLKSVDDEFSAMDIQGSNIEG